MRIPVDRESEVPLYQQIVSFIRSGILSGNLTPDSRLPSSRKLASDLGINRITAANAYAELEADGLIYSRQGSGTYVARPFSPPPETDSVRPQPDNWPAWQQTFSSSASSYSLRTMDDLLGVYAGDRQDMVYLNQGIPDPRLFPVDEFRKVLQSVIRRDGIEAFGYGDRMGFPPLRRTIAYILGQDGIPTHPDDLLVTSGSQQAISLVIQVLTHPGDTILVECPTYSGALDVFRAAGLKIIGVPVDERGMQVERLEALVREYQPKLLYTIPNFQNPTGVCMTGQRRRALIAQADYYDIPLLEDDFVGDLRYEGRAQPALKALDPGGRVIYISTFSKMLAPGLRVGYILANGPVREALLAHKRITDLATSNLIQRTLEAYITVGRYQAHLRRACQVYRRRRNAMTSALQACLPLGIRFVPPHGGLFVWVQLPSGCSSNRLFPFACEEGVVFTPGSLCCPDGTGEEFFRLTFSTTNPEQIETGVRRLGNAIRRCFQFN